MSWSRWWRSAPAPKVAPANTAPAVPPAPAPAQTGCATLAEVVVCGVPYEAPSHGGEEFARDAHYTVDNHGTKPVDITVDDLAIVDPAGARLPLALDVVMWGPVAHGTTTTLDPGAKLDVRIYGAGSIATLRYHVVYHHEAHFRASGAEAVVTAGELYFRHPHRR